jgi:hypothetical protein
MRYYELTYKEKGRNDVVEFLRAYPDVNLRYVVGPSDETVMTHNVGQLLFNREKLEPMLNLGIKDGIAAVNAGETFAKDTFIEWESNVDGIKDRHPDFLKYLLRRMKEVNLEKSLEE